MLLIVLLAIPFLAAILLELTALGLRHGPRIGMIIHVGAALGTCAAGILLAAQVWPASGIVSGFGLLRVDPLSAFFAAVVSGVSSLVGFSALSREGGIAPHRRPTIHRLVIGRWTLSVNRCPNFYAPFHLLVAAMLLVVVANHLSLLWSAVAGAVLILAHMLNRQSALAASGPSSGEIARNYLLMVTPGLALALLATAIIALAGAQAGGAAQSLRWDVLAATTNLSPPELRIALIFALIGYGMISGLAPLHIWLPSIVGVAPAPIVALMTGALASTGMCVILRFKVLADVSLGSDFSQTVLLGMGVISLLVATVFVLIQHDYKRLLAYLITGHMGVICLGLGFGGFGGTLGAILHLVNLALIMVLVWLVAGYITLTYRSTAISDVQGLLWARPVAGGFYLLGVLALAGLPPFGFFLSFIMIIEAGMVAGIVWVAISATVLHVIIVVALLRAIHAMLYGNIPDHVITDQRWRWMAAPLLLNVAALLALSVIMPSPIIAALVRVANFVSP
ncbi:MAG: hypothetical protein MI924_02450 [Chloroflexales bacterium]|nr:hypothetical protein [Chloroflexales bacterium]